MANLLDTNILARAAQPNAPEYAVMNVKLFRRFPGIQSVDPGMVIGPNIR